MTGPAALLSAAGRFSGSFSRRKISGFFKFLRHILEQLADGQMLGTDLFAFAAFETVGRSAAGHGMDDAVVMQPKPTFFLTLSMSDTPFVF